MRNNCLILTQNNATKENVQNALGTFWKNPDMSDVTLATEDGSQQKAHKVILASSSPFFENLFQSNPHPNLLIYLKGVSNQMLEMVLKFVYLGQVEVLQQDLNVFLDIGKELQITGLVEEDAKLVQSENQGNLSPTQAGKLKSPDQPSSPPSVPGPGDDQKQGRYFEPPFKKVPIPSQANVGHTQTSGANNKIELLKGPPQRQNDRVENLDESFSLLLEPVEEKATDPEKPERKENQAKTQKFPCDQCEGMYASRASVYSHKRYVHERSYKDNDQKEKLHQPKYLQKKNEGKRSYGGPASENLYKCDKCDLAFDRMPNLYTHKKAEHGGSLHACDACEYEATQAANLERHKRTEHGA